MRNGRRSEATGQARVAGGARKATGRARARERILKAAGQAKRRSRHANNNIIT